MHPPLKRIACCSFALVCAFVVAACGSANAPGMSMDVPQDGAAGPNASLDGGRAEVPSAPGCRSLAKEGATCAFDIECCSAFCHLGTCAQSPVGGSCDDTANCKVGACDGGRCKVSNVGQVCDKPQACGSQNCKNGLCACSPSVDDTCVSANDCCAGLACYDGSCVKAKAQACTRDAECLAQSCPGGVCACGAPQSRCLADADCCTGKCSAGRYGSPVGEACTVSTTCAAPPHDGPNACPNGVCVCADANDACVTSADCCSGTCSNPKGYGFGTCDWSYAGQTCLSDYTCLTHNGGGSCQKDGKCDCSPDKGPCRSTADCCSGGECKVEPSSGNVQCVGGPPGKPPCVRSGQASVTGNDCCKGLKSAGVETACCGDVAYACTKPSDCCSGSCTSGKCE
jgi:hypothetical protein